MELIERARVYATAAHAGIGQKRKYTKEPYIVHPTRVAATVARVGGTPEMIAAAYLHDVVEDTHVEMDDIRAEFGNKVADLVDWLTDISKPEDGNRKTRKAMDAAHTAQAPAEAQTIKLADIIDNTFSIEEYDPSFAVVFTREKAALLDVLTKGDQSLWNIAAEQIKRFREGAKNTPQIERD